MTGKSVALVTVLGLTGLVASPALAGSGSGHGVIAFEQNGQPLNDALTTVKMRASNGETVFHVQGGPPMEGKRRLLEPGSYRLISFMQRCNGSCPDRPLGPRVGTCRKTVALGQGERVDMTIHLRRARACRIHNAR